MFFHRRFPVIQYQVIGWQIFAEVGHPAVNSDIQAVFFHHLVLEPFIGGRICEVHDPTVKFSKIHQIITAVCLCSKYAFFFPPAVQLAVIDKIRINIA